jgi:hypothetical protein
MAFCLPEWWVLNDYTKNIQTLCMEMVGQVNILALKMYSSKQATTPQEADQYFRGVVEKNKAKQLLWII